MLRRISKDFFVTVAKPAVVRDSHKDGTDTGERWTVNIPIVVWEHTDGKFANALALCRCRGSTAALASRTGTGDTDSTKDWGAKGGKGQVWSEVGIAGSCRRVKWIDNQPVRPCRSQESGLCPIRGDIHRSHTGI